MWHKNTKEERIFYDKKIQVALAGLGSRGKDTYAPTARLFSEKMEIVAIADIDPAKELSGEEEQT